MYKFIDQNTVSAHDEFVKKHPLCSTFQSAKWAEVKDNWDHALTAVYDDDKIVAAALVLIKHLPLNFCMMYIPRGPVMDYKNHELVEFYLTSLRKWAKKKKCVFITLDPALPIRQFYMEHEADTTYDKDVLSFIDSVKAMGGVFKGFTKDMKYTIQPRFHMGLYYKNEWEKDIPKQTMSSIRKALSKHVEMELISFDKLDEFSRIMHITEERKGIHLRNKAYFEKLLRVYGDDAHVFMAKVNPQKRAKELNERMLVLQARLQDENIKEKGIRKANEEIRMITDELNSFKAVLNDDDKDVYIACGLMVTYGSWADMMYAGMDDAYRMFRPQYFLYYKQFEMAFTNGYQYATMGGVEGSLDDGLSEFKSKFHPTVTEYVGEFDLPCMTLFYKAAKFLQRIKTGK